MEDGGAGGHGRWREVEVKAERKVDAREAKGDGRGWREVERRVVMTGVRWR